LGKTIVAVERRKDSWASKTPPGVTGGLSLVADLIQNQPNQPGTTFGSAAFLLI
jgi:hypothetical protein